MNVKSTTRIVPRRRGYSMMEIVVVLSVLAGMAALAYPLLKPPIAKLRLQAAGQEVATELAKARVKAMQSGVAQVFRVQLHTGKFQVLPASESDDDAPAEAKSARLENAKDDSVQANSAERSPMTEPDDEFVEEKELPEGIVFEAPTNDQSPEQPVTKVVEDDDGWLDFAVFYPDGGTTNAVVGLHGEPDICLDVKLSGLTGVARIGETHRQELR